MKHSKKQNRKSFLTLTPAERDKDISRFDQEIDIEKETRPLTAKERLFFELVRRQGAGAKHSVPVDPKLLDKAVAAAHRQGVSLEEFVSKSIRGMLASSRR
jgi:hypothetical protein